MANVYKTVMFICRVVAEAACNGTSQILNQIAFPFIHLNNFPRYYCLELFGGGAILKVLELAFKVWKKTREIKVALQLLKKEKLVKLKQQHYQFRGKKLEKSKQQHDQFGEIKLVKSKQYSRVLEKLVKSMNSERH